MLSFRSPVTLSSAKAVTKVSLRGVWSARRRTASAVSTACLCAPLACHALDISAAGTTGASPAVSVTSEWVASQRDFSTSAATSAPQAAMLSGAMRSTVWARSGAAAVGVGVETAKGTVASHTATGASGERALAANPSLLVGVAVDTTPRSRLVLDTPLPYRNSAALVPDASGREVRVGLVIKPADPLKTLRAGQLFKVELSGRAQLAVKPRSGGVALSYSSKF